MECQIQEGDTGDMVLLGGTVLSTTVQSLQTDGPKRYSEGGISYTSALGGSEYIYKSTTHDLLEGWNTVEITVRGDAVTHKINGVVNFRGTAIRQLDPANPGNLLPLTKGRILLQAEGAEILFRNIRIRPLRP